MAVAKIDIETLRCIQGTSDWELCTKIKNIRRRIEALEATVYRLLEP